MPLLLFLKAKLVYTHCRKYINYAEQIKQNVSAE